MKTEPNDSMSPIFGYDQTYLNVEVRASGLTKREYFAAMAMQGILSEQRNHAEPYRYVVGNAVTLADLLIDALNKPEP